jgi:hypothetical protein
MWRQHPYLYIGGYHAGGMPDSAELGGTGEVDHLIDHTDAPVGFKFVLTKPHPAKSQLNFLQARLSLPI